MINLTCPSCVSELEIDDGFRGGVCRCFDCGTLMTVPDAPDVDRPETLSRPDSPDAPVLAEPDDEEDILDIEKTGEFITSSGQRVRLSSRQLQQVPVARKKRMGVRITVVALMMSVVLVIVVCIIYGMWVIFAPPVIETPGDIAKRLYQYDINKNPFTTPRATFFSIEIPGDEDRATVLMTDSSSAMRDGYLDWTKHNMWAVIPLMDLKQPVQIVFWRDSAPMVYPLRPTRVKDIPRQLLHSKLTELSHSGGIDAVSAFNKVMRSVPPARIFVAAHQLPPDNELQRIVGMVQDAGTELIWVHLGPHTENDYLLQSADDSDLINYVPIPDGVLQRWYVEEYLGERNGPLLEELDPANKKSPPTEPDEPEDVDDDDAPDE